MYMALFDLCNDVFLYLMSCDLLMLFPIREFPIIYKFPQDTN